jgi:hypothetical protein
MTSFISTEGRSLRFSKTALKTLMDKGLTSPGAKCHPHPVGSGATRSDDRETEHEKKETVLEDTLIGSFARQMLAAAIP